MEIIKHIERLKLNTDVISVYSASFIRLQLFSPHLYVCVEQLLCSCCSSGNNINIDAFIMYLTKPETLITVYNNKLCPERVVCIETVLKINVLRC